MKMLMMESGVLMIKEYRIVVEGVLLELLCFRHKQLRVKGQYQLKEETHAPIIEVEKAKEGKFR